MQCILATRQRCRGFDDTTENETMTFPAAFDGRVVTIENASAVLGLSVQALRAALAWEDFAPSADGLILFGVARRAAERFPQPAAHDDDSRMHRMRAE